MSQLNSFKIPSVNYKHSHLNIISNCLSGVLGVGIGLIIGNYLGWL